MNMEVGLRSHVNETLTYDLELWHNRTKNFSARGIVSSAPDGIISSFLNIPLEVEQSGITANLNYEISDKLDIQYFLTFQETQLDDAYDTLTVLSDPRDRRHQATPTWFGGFVANYDIRENWYLNVNGTFTEARTIIRFRGTKGEVDHIYLLNAKLAYEHNEDLTFYVTGKNLLDTDKNEFPWTDRSEMSVYLGMDFRPEI